MWQNNATTKVISGHFSTLQVKSKVLKKIVTKHRFCWINWLQIPYNNSSKRSTASCCRSETKVGNHLFFFEFNQMINNMITATARSSSVLLNLSVPYLLALVEPFIRQVISSTYRYTSFGQLPNWLACSIHTRVGHYFTLF